ncbi:hypothetical protein [Marinilabilia salmonicolor]|uniref:hypothetical protein n=1 Tax=Marinilabilia salmonicolor TaxID=989 RepID=UPI00046A735D|nr:hypothetical protein [Marinilabilia salmonicolor]
MNTPPLAPGQLQAVMDGDTLVFSWDMAQDEETPPYGLYYNVFVFTAASGPSVLSPMSDDDFLKKTFTGNAGNRNTLKLAGPVSATYFWSVQTIDQALPHRSLPILSRWWSQRSRKRRKHQAYRFIPILPSAEYGYGVLRQAIIKSGYWMLPGV